MTMAQHATSLGVLAVLAGLGLPGAHAEPRSGLGGGFLELLVTGRDPTPRPWVEPQGQGRPVAPVAPRAQAQGQTASVQRVSAPAAVAPAPKPAPVVHSAAIAAPAPAPALAQGAGAGAKFARQEVAYEGPHEAGVVVVDTPNRFLFLVLGNGRALRYGIGVGRPGFEWAGVKSVTRKAEWPDWTPPPEMLKRRPELPRHMAGGENNPLGARALYLGSSLYRIHGTNEPDTIGHNVSSGCIRMMNADVMDLYERVKLGTKVVVI
jgi:lipoprotein-anchoring transpeptidase ErfK/SrfK